jgi:hypothetical protein
MLPISASRADSYAKPRTCSLDARVVLYSDRVPTLEGESGGRDSSLQQASDYLDQGGIALLKRQRAALYERGAPPQGFGVQTYNQRWRGDATAVLL